MIYNMHRNAGKERGMTGGVALNEISTNIIGPLYCNVNSSCLNFNLHTDAMYCLRG